MCLCRILCECVCVCGFLFVLTTKFPAMKNFQIYLNFTAALLLLSGGLKWKLSPVCGFIFFFEDKIGTLNYNNSVWGYCLVVYRVVTQKWKRSSSIQISQRRSNGWNRPKSNKRTHTRAVYTLLAYTENPKGANEFRTKQLHRNSCEINGINQNKLNIHQTLYPGNADFSNGSHYFGTLLIETYRTSEKVDESKQRRNLMENAINIKNGLSYKYVCMHSMVGCEYFSCFFFLFFFKLKKM